VAIVENEQDEPLNVGRRYARLAIMQG
jgi:hypothetical protein